MTQHSPKRSNRMGQDVSRQQSSKVSASAATNQGNQTARQRTRERRRVQEEKLARAQAEEAARERRRQTTIGIVVVVIVVALLATIGGVVGYNLYKKHKNASFTVKQAYSALQQVKTRPSTANKEGGILISHEGYGKKAAGAPTVEIYMDPMCPGCGEFHQEVGSTLKQMLDAGQINLVYHPLNFEDNLSTDNYSTRAAGALAYVAAHDPDVDHFMKFIDNLYDKNYQPQEGNNYVPTSNDKIKAQALKAGVPKSVMNKAFAGTYNAWLNAAFKYTVRRPELWNQSGQYKGSMTTPTVAFNGHTLDMNKVSEHSINQKTAVLGSLGLSESQVGAEGEMPSIGESGKPMALW